MRRDNTTKSKYWRTLVTALFLLGTASIVRSISGTVTDSTGTLTAAMIVCAIVIIIFRYADRLSRYEEMIPWILAGTAVVMSGFVGIIRGALVMYNAVLCLWSGEHGGGAMLIGVGGIRASDVICFDAAAVCILAGLFIMLMNRRMLVCIWIETLSAAVFATIVNVISPEALSALILCGVLYWLGHVNRESTSVLKITVLIIIAAGIAVLAVIGNQDMTAVTEAKAKAESAVDKWKYGEDTLPKGDLRDAAGLHDGSRITLEVTDGIDESVYFRGYVGSRYSDGIWEEPAGFDYGGEYAGIMRWLDDREFQVQSQYEQYAGLSGETPAGMIKVSNKGAYRKYIYMPYYASGSVTGADCTAAQDMQYRSDSLRGSTEYSCSARVNNMPAEISVVEEWVTNPGSDEQKAYSESEQIYRGFVHDRYMELSGRQRKLMNRYFWDENHEKVPGVYSATERIRTVLDDRTEYTEAPDAPPADEDPVEWFLTSGKRGNSVYYASAAVMAFRAYGIPARYAEGYYQQPGSGGRAVLTNKDSHAWVEVYMDGMGWMPVDVTPGYYYDTVALQEMINSPDREIKAAMPDMDDEDSSGSSEGGNSGIEGEDDSDFSVSQALAAVFVILMMAICIPLMISIFRSICQWRKFAAYSALDDSIKPDAAYRYLAKTFKAMEISMTIGYNADLTEARLADRIESIEEGEYLRINEILEKYYYSSSGISRGELNTLEIFCEKIVISSSKKWRRRGSSK